MKPVHLCLLPAVAALSLTACASPGDYPSLARRDVERITGLAKPVTPDLAAAPAPAAPDAPLSENIARLVEQASGAHHAFASQQGRARQLIAAGAGAPEGSEKWAVANMALSGLESSRSETMIALAGLDALYADDRLTHFNEESADAQAIAASRERILGWIGEENATLTALRGQLGG